MITWYTRGRFCRWCQTEYKPTRDKGRDGFCNTHGKGACRQAHHRAFKKWKERHVIEKSSMERLQNELPAGKNNGT